MKISNAAIQMLVKDNGVNHGQTQGFVGGHLQWSDSCWR